MSDVDHKRQALADMVSEASPFAVELLRAVRAMRPAPSAAQAVFACRMLALVAGRAIVDSEGAAPAQAIFDIIDAELNVSKVIDGTFVVGSTIAGVHKNTGRKAPGPEDAVVFDIDAWEGERS